MGETSVSAKRPDAAEGYICRKQTSLLLDKTLRRHLAACLVEIDGLCAGGGPRYIPLMKPFIAIVHKEPGSAYGVTFPDAPGCFSAADEMDDLFANAAEALALWVEGLHEEGSSAPEARDLSQIKADPRWAEAFVDAALVIAVPAPQPPVRRAA
jgi:predicted RNase H-like HicB family nuclease